MKLPTRLHRSKGILRGEPHGTITVVLTPFLLLVLVVGVLCASSYDFDRLAAQPRTGLSALVDQLQRDQWFVQACLTSSGGAVLMSDTGQFELRRISALEGQELPRDTTCLAVAGTGHTVMTGHFDGSLRLWRAEQEDLPPVRLDAHAETVHVLALDDEGRVAASASCEEAVQLWDLTTGRRLSRLSYRGEPVLAARLIMSPSGQFVGVRRLLQFTCFRVLDASPLDGDWKDVLCAAFSPCDRFLVAVQNDGTVACWALDTAAERWRSESTGHHPGDVAVAISNDGGYAAAIRGGIAHIWEVETGRLVHVSQDPMPPVRALRFLDSTDPRAEQRLAAIACDGEIYCWPF
jgi:WD40 repeat protein